MMIEAISSKLFNLRAGEWRRLSLLYVMSLVVLTAANWADAVLQGAFLQRVGVQSLPWVMISCSACSIVTLFIYTAFADRVSNTRLLIVILVISGVGILLGLAGLAAGLVGSAYLLLFLVLNVPLLDLYNVHWATYVNDFYDIRSAKRIVPILSTTSQLAGIIAGFSMPLMNRIFSPSAIILATVVSLAIMATLAAAMPRLLHEQRARSSGQTGAIAIDQAVPQPVAAAPSLSRWSRVQGFAAGYRDRMREGYQQINGSPFLRWMAISTLIMTLLLVMLNYRVSAIFQSELKTTVAISDYIGLLYGIANLVVLPFQLFVLSRLITRLGLGNATLVYPVVTLATVGGLAVSPGLGTAALGYLDRSEFRTAFRLPTDNLLYNAVPSHVKARTRAFISGLVLPIGSMLSSLLLLTPLVRTSWFLPVAIVVLGLMLALASLMVRRHYGQALVDLLEQEDYSSLALQAPSFQEPVTFTVADPATLSGLANKLSESTSHERIIFLAQLITAVGGEAAVPVVVKAAQAATNGRLRASLIDVLVAADVRRGGARELFIELVDDGDSRVRLAAIGGLEQIDGPGDVRYLELAARLLADPEIEVRLRVLPALLAAGDVRWQVMGTGELRALLKATQPHTRARALSMVGHAHLARFLPEAASALSDVEDEARLAAALAVEMLVGEGLSADEWEILLTPVLDLLRDPIERVRMAAVTILGQLSLGDFSETSVASQSLIAGLADPSPEVRKRTVVTLARSGRRAIPPMQKLCDGADSDLRKMAAVVLARIDPRKFAALVRGSALDENLLAIYRSLCNWHALSGFTIPAVEVLGSALRERNATLRDEIFYLMAMIQNPDAIRIVAHSFQSSQPEVRANATEALESLTSPRIAALLSPLFEPGLPSEQLLSLAKQTWDLSVPTAVEAIRQLFTNSSDTWQRILVTAALVELSTSADFVPVGQIAELLVQAQADQEPGVREEACQANTGWGTVITSGEREVREPRSLSIVGKLILLRKVPFFQGMSTDQLRMLASVCEEEHFAKGMRIFNQGDAGGVFYFLLSGRVAIEQEKRKGFVVQLVTVDAHSYLGESDFFDNSYCTHSAVALEDTHTLRLRREPITMLARQDPSLSLELIKMLSVRLREASNRVAELTQTHSREMHKIYDEFA